MKNLKAHVVIDIDGKKDKAIIEYPTKKIMAAFRTNKEESK